MLPKLLAWVTYLWVFHEPVLYIVFLTTPTFSLSLDSQIYDICIYIQIYTCTLLFFLWRSLTNTEPFIYIFNFLKNGPRGEMFMVQCLGNTFIVQGIMWCWGVKFIFPHTKHVLQSFEILLQSNINLYRWFCKCLYHALDFNLSPQNPKYFIIWLFENLPMLILNQSS